MEVSLLAVFEARAPATTIVNFFFSLFSYFSHCPHTVVYSLRAGFFHDGGPMHTGLERVLMCYVCYRPDVGYVQVSARCERQYVPETPSIWQAWK
jgi:hypothetical protein